jgi:hypothetical protein
MKFRGFIVIFYILIQIVFATDSITNCQVICSSTDVLLIATTIIFVIAAIY